MSTLTPSGVRTKVIPIIHQGNVRNIRRKSVSVPAMTTTSNAIRLNGVPTTGITLRPALCRPLLMDSARTASLITNNVKKTDHVLVGKPDMSIPVRRGGCMLLQTVVLMINLMASAVTMRLQKDVRAITKLLVTRRAALPVPIPAVIHVIDVVPTNVPAGQRTIPARTLQQLSAVRLAVTVKTVLPEAAITQVLMPVLPSAEAVITVPIPAVPVRSPCLVLGMKTKSVFLIPNAEQAVTNVNITLTVPQQIKIVIMVALIQTLAVNVHPASPNRLNRLLRRRINVREARKDGTVFGSAITTVGNLSDIARHQNRTR